MSTRPVEVPNPARTRLLVRLRPRTPTRVRLLVRMRPGRRRWSGCGPDAPQDAEDGPDAPQEAGYQPDGRWHAADNPDPVDERPNPGPVPWPDATSFLPPAPAALRNLQPAGSGFLDLRLHWLTLAHGGPEPGYLTRLGPITPAQASYLALLAAADPAVEWRAVVTDNAAG